MPDQKWIDAKNEIAAFKQYVTAKGLPADTPRSYLLTKEEIERLLAQKSTGSLDGIRIYVGLKTVNNVVVPTITVVGAEKDAVTAGKYNDFNIPVFTAVTSIAARTSSVVATSSVDGNEELPPDDGGDDTPGDTIDDGMATPRPCPNTCSDENGLNS